MLKFTKFLAGIVATGTIAYADDLPVIKSSKAPVSLDVPTIPEAPAKLPTTKLPTTKVLQPQTPTTPVTPMTPVAPAAVPPSTVIVAATADTPSQTYATFDYLMWWYRNGNSPPLLTQSSQADGGILGRGTTAVLFGDKYETGIQSGFRGTVGTMLDPSRSTGIEATVMYFGPQNRTQINATGAPGIVLAVPFNNVTGGGTGGIQAARLGAGGAAGENSYLIANESLGAGFPGRVNITTSSRLWGAELNGVMRSVRENGIQVETLVGFRYLDLQESIDMTAESFNNGNRFAPGNGNFFFRHATFTDSFATKNSFYGGQVGLRASTALDRLTLMGTAKVGIGYNRQTVRMNGTFNDPDPFYTSNYGYGSQGGLLTAQSNSGVFNANKFSVVPEAEIAAGYQITSRLKFMVGYNFLYMSNVARPGDQIDRNINLNQIANTPFTQGGIPLAGPPAPGFGGPVSSGFFAQGVSFGFKIDY